MARALHIGVLGAMPEEIGSDLSHLQQLESEQHGDLTIHHGTWAEGIRLSLAWSGWGKVSAARAATRLLSSAPDIDLLLFTGVAGAADPALTQWDVVLADAVVQHDMDSRPLFPRFTLPALNRAQLNPDSSWLRWASTALAQAAQAGELDGFGTAKHRPDRDGGPLHRRCRRAGCPARGATWTQGRGNGRCCRRTGGGTGGHAMARAAGDFGWCRCQCSPKLRRLHPDVRPSGLVSSSGTVVTGRAGT